MILNLNNNVIVSKVFISNSLYLTITKAAYKDYTALFQYPFNFYSMRVLFPLNI